MAPDERIRASIHEKLVVLIGTEEAAALMEMLPPERWTELATKRDLEDLRLATKADIEELRLATTSDIEGLQLATTADIEGLRGEVKADIEGLRGEVKADIEGLRVEVKSDIEGLRGEVKSGIEGLRGEVKSGIEGLRGEVKADIEGLRGEMKSDIGLLRSDVTADIGLLRSEMKSEVEKSAAFVGQTTDLKLEALEYRMRTGFAEVRSEVLETRADLVNQISAAQTALSFQIHDTFMKLVATLVPSILIGVGLAFSAAKFA